MNGDELWNKVINSLKLAEEVQTTRGLWFTVYGENDNLYIDKAIKQIPSSNISKRRRITKKDFLFVHSYYERWASGEKGVTQEAKQQSQNVSYIFAIIKKFSNNN